MQTPDEFIQVLQINLAKLIHPSISKSKDLCYLEYKYDYYD